MVKNILRPIKHWLFGKDGIYKAMEYVDKDAEFIIDVGAANGQYTKLFHKKFPKALIWAFEPIQNTRENWLWIEECERVFLWDKALSNEIGKETIYFEPNSLDGSSFHDRRSGRRKKDVRIDTLDSHVFPRRCDFMKIDVEGHELEVLLGSEISLNETKFLYVEISRNEYHVLQLLEKAGFELLWVSEWNNYFFRKKTSLFRDHPKWKAIKEHLDEVKKVVSN